MGQKGFQLLLVAVALLLCWPLQASLPLLEWPCQRALVTRSATNMPPYAYLDPRQQLTGYRIEVLRLLFQRLQCPLQIRTDSPWKRSLVLLQAGEMDLLVNASRSPEREAFAYFSQAGDSEFVSLFALKQQQHRIVLTDISAAFSGHYNIGLIRGNFYGAELAPLLSQPQVKPHLVEAIDKPGLYQLLLKKRVDLYLDYYPNGLLALRDEALDSQIVRLPLPPVHIGDTHYMFSRKSVSPAFIQAFDEELARMQADGSIAGLKAKYSLTGADLEISQQGH